MSPYIHDEGYSSTLARTKMLWLEFASPPDDDNDRYFCRALKYAPDPSLVGNFSREAAFESEEPSPSTLSPCAASYPVKRSTPPAWTPCNPSYPHHHPYTGASRSHQA